MARLIGAKLLFCIIACLLALTCYDETPEKDTEIVYQETKECQYKRPYVLGRKITSNEKDSLAGMLSLEIDALKQIVLGKSGNNGVFNVNGGWVSESSLEKILNEESYYAGKGETVTLMVDLICTYLSFSQDTSLLLTEREFWENKFHTMDNKLEAFITQEINIDDKDTIIIEKRPPKPESIKDFSYEFLGATIRIQGQYRNAEFDPNRQVMWVFLQKNDNLFSRPNSQPIFSGKENSWETFLHVAPVDTFQGITIMAFPHSKLKKLKEMGNSGYQLADLEAMDGMFLTFKLLQVNDELS